MSPMSVSSLMNESSTVLPGSPTPSLQRTISEPSKFNLNLPSPLTVTSMTSSKAEVSSHKHNSPLAKTPKKRVPAQNASNDNKLSTNETATTKATGEKEKDNGIEKEKENEPMIIDIEIPLSTHNDVHAEYNFSKLVEEKYGKYDQSNSLAKNLWNFVDDDDDGDADADADADADDDENEEEDADIDTGNITNNGPTETANSYDDEDEIVRALKIKFKPGMSDVEKESLVLKEIHRRKMENNKRIGKYDVDDPFIDDEELEFEEKVNTNADGWFIWYGKLEPAKKKEGKVSSTKAERITKATKSSSTSASTTGNSSSATTQASARVRPAAASAPPLKKRKKDTTAVSGSLSSLGSTRVASSAHEEVIDLPSLESKRKTPLAKSVSASQNPSQTGTAEEDSTTKSGTPTPASNIIIGSFGF
jgi:hypothetical protein